MPDPIQLLRAAYGPLLALSDRAAATRDEPLGWTPTALPGWTVRDLLFHLASDAQRALVALHTPAAGAPDTDAVTYWDADGPVTTGTDAAQAGLRGTRTIATQWSSVAGPADLHRTTARALVHAAGAADLDAVVGTQGRTLTVRDLLSTLVVEAGVHQLDLAAVVDPPAPDVLAHVRTVCDALLGAPTPPDWDDAVWIALATGRRAPTAAETSVLGPAAVGRLPLLG